MHRTPILRLVPALLLMLAAACADAVTSTPPPVDPPAAPPLPLGVYEIQITGLGGAAQLESRIATAPVAIGASPTLTPLTSGIVFEQISSSSFTEGTRTSGGQRYVTFSYRVRNGTGTPLSNLTILMASTASSVGGTPVSSLKRFDGSPADSTIARYIAPTGAVLLGRDGIGMRAAYADVMQAFTEAEVAAITPPAGVTGIFPYGYVVRRAGTQSTRLLPATADANRFDGILTVSFRVPLQSTAALDVFSFSFQVLAVDDSQKRTTESIEEQTAEARAQVAAASAALGASMVTVLAGSPSTGYPGQRQICLLRTAGTAASPLTHVTTLGAYTRLAFYRPGESVSPCGADFRGGTPTRMGPGVATLMTIRAMDRYGNTTASVVDSVELTSPDYVLTTTPRSALVAGVRGFTISFADYAEATLVATGRRLSAQMLLPVEPISRVWTGGTSTTWSTGSNWSTSSPPASLDTAIIPVGTTFQPVLTQPVAIGGVNVANTVTLALGGNTLTAAHDVVTGQGSGGITGTTGRVVLAGSGGRVAGRLPEVRVTGTYSLSGNLLTKTPVDVDLGGGLESVGWFTDIHWY